jgi:hypothetical protein
MNNEMRAAVTEYMFLPTGNEMGGGLELHYPLHPMLERAYKMLNKKFEYIIVNEQDLLSHQVHRDKLNLNTRTLDQILNDKIWNKLFDTFDSSSNAWVECEQKCHTSIVDENYAVGWFTN